MICDACAAQTAQLKFMTRSYGRGIDLLIIEDVPVIVCQHCGESYMTAETMHEIAYKIHYKSLAIPKLVAVAAFA
ncbi:MAG: type II toxin-antitoxin system MqsA family antitoxin [Chloroflexi bacterium]|nr:type II toxin-antitoxin system MqsA family antitoxin [Chloroflexota bacterium]